MGDSVRVWVSGRRRAMRIPRVRGNSLSGGASGQRNHRKDSEKRKFHSLFSGGKLVDKLGKSRKVTTESTGGGETVRGLDLLV